MQKPLLQSRTKNQQNNNAGPFCLRKSSTLHSMMSYLDAVIVEVGDDDFSARRGDGTEVWTGQMARVGRTTRSKLVNDASIWLENVHSTTAIVNDDDTTMRVAADTLRTKQLPRPKPKQRQNNKKQLLNALSHVFIRCNRPFINYRIMTIIQSHKKSLRITCLRTHIKSHYVNFSATNLTVTNSVLGQCSSQELHEHSHSCSWTERKQMTNKLLHM